jgi:predicted nucleic acid-binding protein
MDTSALIARHRGQTVYFDTNIFIYVLNVSVQYAQPCLDLLQACANRTLRGTTGDVTLAELLVKPLQLNDAAGVAAVRELLIEDGAITLISHGRKVFEQAAVLRARHGLKMVDALQLATAIDAGAQCFVSNDRQFPVLPGIECVGLD